MQHFNAEADCMHHPMSLQLVVFGLPSPSQLPLQVAGTNRIAPHRCGAWLGRNEPATQWDGIASALRVGISGSSTDFKSKMEPIFAHESDFFSDVRCFCLPLHR